MKISVKCAHLDEFPETTSAGTSAAAVAVPTVETIGQGGAPRILQAVFFAGYAFTSVFRRRACVKQGHNLGDAGWAKVVGR